MDDGIPMDPKVVSHQVNDAIRIVDELKQANPGDHTLEVVSKQLKHITESYDREQSFKSIPRERLTFGVVAAKNEYDVNYPKFADLLHEISYALGHNG